jgi:hypothetical protein
MYDGLCTFKMQKKHTNLCDKSAKGKFNDGVLINWDCLIRNVCRFAVEKMRNDRGDLRRRGLVRGCVFGGVVFICTKIQLLGNIGGGRKVKSLPVGRKAVHLYSVLSTSAPLHQQYQ